MDLYNTHGERRGLNFKTNKLEHYGSQYDTFFLNEQQNNFY